MGGLKLPAELASDRKSEEPALSVPAHTHGQARFIRVWVINFLIESNSLICIDYFGYDLQLIFQLKLFKNENKGIVITAGLVYTA